MENHHAIKNGKPSINNQRLMFSASCTSCFIFYGVLMWKNLQKGLRQVNHHQISRDICWSESMGRSTMTLEKTFFRHGNPFNLHHRVIELVPGLDIQWTEHPSWPSCNEDPFFGTSSSLSISAIEGLQVNGSIKKLDLCHLFLGGPKKLGKPPL